MPLHSTLTDPELHEPKGVSTATAGEVYLANGSGSGTWATPSYTISGVISDVSTAETIYLPIPYAGTVKKIVTTLGGAITVADSVITAKNSAGSTMGTATVSYSGSAAGDVDTITPASNNTVTDNSFMTVQTDGGSTTTAKLYVTVYIQGS